MKRKLSFSRGCLIKWFKHDSNAHIDAKLKKVKHKYGIVGYGLYWYCIELIAMSVDRNNITFELEEDAETISLEWNLDQLKVQEMMQFMIKLSLFESDGTRITCLKLAKRLDDTNSKNPEIKIVLDRLNKSEQVGDIPINSDSLGESRSESDLLGDDQELSAQIRLDKIRLDKKDKDISEKASPAKPKKAKKTQIDPDLQLSDEWKSSALKYWFTKNRDDLIAEDQFERFVDHQIANAKTSASWGHSWATWYKNAVEFNKKKTVTSNETNRSNQLSTISQATRRNSDFAERLQQQIREADSSSKAIDHG